MKLTKEEGVFLKRQIHMTCADSMMDYMLQHHFKEEINACDRFQDLEKIKHRFPEYVRQDYKIALDFSRFVYILRIQYNRICRQEVYEIAEAEWRAYQPFIKPYSSAVDIDAIFLRLGLVKRARNKWLYDFLDVCKKALLQDDIETVNKAIINREGSLKGKARSRTANPLPGDIQEWFTGGFLEYRYGNAKTIMKDIFESEAE